MSVRKCSTEQNVLFLFRNNNLQLRGIRQCHNADREQGWKQFAFSLVLWTQLEIISLFLETYEVPLWKGWKISINAIGNRGAVGGVAVRRRVRLELTK